MRAGAEGEDVRGRAAQWGVNPSEGSVGLERRAEERRWGVMKGVDATGGLNRSWEWILWSGGLSCTLAGLVLDFEDSFNSSSGHFAFRCCTGDPPGASLPLHVCTEVQVLKGSSKQRVLMIALSSFWCFVDP